MLVTRVGTHREIIEAQGIRVVPLPWQRSGSSWTQELGALWALWRIYRRERPDVVHHVALKPIVYGSMARWFAPVGLTVNAIAGLGFAFIGSTVRARVVQRALKLALRCLLRGRRSRVVVQNADDATVVQTLGVPKTRVRIIRGAGVDPVRFSVSDEPPGDVVVTAVSRLLWDKGIGELVEASRLLRERGCAVVVRLVGAAGDDNPASIPHRTVEGWVRDGLVEWTGHRDDIPAVWREAHIAVLPSYREGLPKALLEAAACGRPIVATDVPGCKEIAQRDENALLVPPRDAVSLADAIETLVNDPAMRARFGKASRRLVESNFTEATIAAQTLALYEAGVNEPSQSFSDDGDDR